MTTQKQKKNQTRKKGRGVINNFRKKINIVANDPFAVNRQGRDTDIVLLASIFDKNEWRQVKKNILELSQKPLKLVSNNAEIFKRAKDAKLQF